MASHPALGMLINGNRNSEKEAKKEIITAYEHAVTQKL